MEPNCRHTVKSFDGLRKEIEARGLFYRSRWLVFGELSLIMGLYGASLFFLESLLSLVLASVAAITLVWWIHDAGHAAYFKNRKMSDRFIEALGILFLGMSQIEYHGEEHRIHHAYTNIVGRDMALETGPIKWHPKQLRSGKSFLKFQNVLWLGVVLPLVWPLMSIRSIQELRKKGAFIRITLLGLRWLTVLELFHHHLAFVFVPALIAGFVMGFVSSLNHFHMPMDDVKQDIFPASVFKTTQNLSEKSFFVTWLYGGLNYHIEHHLFPKMPSRNLKRVQPLVEAFAREHGLPYANCSTLEAFKKLHDHLLNPVKGLDMEESAAQQVI